MEPKSVYRVAQTLKPNPLIVLPIAGAAAGADANA